MWNRYLRWNQRSIKWLWGLVILGVLASLPIAFERYQMESETARKVEFVFDYRDLIEISDTQTDPRQFILDHLKKIKDNGVRSLAVYESTLNELKQSRRIELYTSHEATALTQVPVSPNENYTYLLFADASTESRLRPLIEQTFTSLNVSTRPWTYKNQPGMIIEMAMDEALMKTMDPDPIAMQELKELGFHLVVRMSNRRPFDEAQMDRLLGEFKRLGIKRFIIDGETVPGFVSDSEPENIDKMAELMKKHGIGLAAIELQRAPQRGFNRLAQKIDYNVVRLHSFTEADGQKLTENLTEEELKGRIQGVTDRLVLAVKDRNIRMVFLNARAVKNTDKAMILHPLDSIYDALNGPDGALNRIQHAGYTLGIAERFYDLYSGWQPIAKGFIWLGAVALIALAVGFFVPESVLALFLLGMVGSAGLYAMNAHLFAQALALGAGTCAPTIAVMMAVRAARRRKEEQRGGSNLFFAILLLLRATVVSATGICFIVGLLNQIQYSLVLDQFRGVSVLHLAPIVLVALFWLLFSDRTNYAGIIGKTRQLLAMNISVLWVVVAAVLAAVGYYYLSRTGNEGQVSGIERVFRAYLENTMGVRPRTKEFLLAHPLFLLGAYLCVKYRSAVLLILAGVIGQASIVDTFAHLHTPLVISSIRVMYGLLLGTAIGLVLIIAWEIVDRSWRRWVLK